MIIELNDGDGREFTLAFASVVLGFWRWRWRCIRVLYMDERSKKETKKDKKLMSGTDRSNVFGIDT